MAAHLAALRTDRDAAARYRLLYLSRRLRHTTTIVAKSACHTIRGSGTIKPDTLINSIDGLVPFPKYPRHPAKIGRPMKLLIYPAVDSDRLRRIQAAAPGIRLVNAATAMEARGAMADADAMFGKITPELLASARQLRWIQAPTAGMERFLFPELVAHSCVVTGMRGIYSDVIADHVYGYLLCFVRNLHVYIRQQLQASWNPVGREQHRQSLDVAGGIQSAMDRAHGQLGDRTLGLVGFGHIGREIARRAPAFRLRVIAVDTQCESPPPEVHHLWPPDQLHRLLELSDFVVITAPHTPETAGLFRRAQLQSMRRTAFLVNVGRGAIVDLDDLCAALVAQEIAGAALDVFETEPLPASHPLWQMENVIITPHVAACCQELAERHLAIVVDNVARFAAGEPLRNVVDKRLWY